MTHTFKVGQYVHISEPDWGEYDGLVVEPLTDAPGRVAVQVEDGIIFDLETQYVTPLPVFKPGDLVHVEYEWTVFDGTVLEHNPATTLVFVIDPATNQVHAVDQKHVAPVSVPLYRIIQYIYQVSEWTAKILLHVQNNGEHANNDAPVHLGDVITYEWYDRNADSDELKTITLTPELYELVKF